MLGSCNSWVLWRFLIFSLVIFCRPIVTAAEKCTACKKNLAGKVMRVGTQKLHPQCFRCSSCRAIIGVEYSQSRNRFFHTYCFRKVNGLVCGHCGKVLGKTWIAYDGKKFHDICYKQHVQPRCEICRLPIEKLFALEKGLKYHVGCFRRFKLPKCTVCSLSLEGTHLVDPWGNAFHAQHQGQTPTCFSCARALSPTSSKGGRRLEDGRYICGYCGATSIYTPEQVRVVRDSALKTLASVGIDGFPKEVGIRLVDRYGLNRLTKGMNLHTRGEMRGLTQSQETIEKNRRVATKHTIHLLKHLPSLEMEGILAHELMHVWLFENRVKLSLKESEGFCNLGNHLVFSRNQTPMATYLLTCLKEDQDVIYGEGYREMLKQLDALGWAKLLARLKIKKHSAEKKKPSFFRRGRN